MEKPLVVEGDRLITDDLEALVDALPPRIRTALENLDNRSELLEVVMDLGRRAEARFPGREVFLTEDDVSKEDIQFVVSHVGEFGGDNRAGIERTLHRISAIRNRSGEIVGLTSRIGRAVYGTIAIIRDLVETGESILLLGRPGVGKTTMLREVARVLADDFKKRVIIVDTSNEIAGDGDIPHPAIGRSRRMQVPSPDLQHAVMIEAVENHMPEVIVIDEIGTELEAAAARTIAERGVQLVATAHGNTLENLMMNPTLSDLVGGIQTVTLSDEEARRRGTQKSILERKAPPTFDILVEIQDWNRVAVHRNVADTVDAILRGDPVGAEVRERMPDGEVEIRAEPAREQAEIVRGRAARRGATTLRQPGRRAAARTPALPAAQPGKLTKVYPFGISRNRLEQASRELNVPVEIVKDVRDADIVMTVKSYYRKRPQALRQAEVEGVPVYVLKSNTVVQMENSLSGIYHLPEEQANPVMAAMQETEDAIGQVMDTDRPVELSPQSSYIRRLQHQLADRYNLESQSTGREPFRRVRIFRGRGA
ncbi:MAG: AAA family ATPase [Chloroflexi bacterium]|nr:AAA family ATPase [Chloroflexota bacterium]